MRVFPNKFGMLRLPEAGCYGKDMRGNWWCRIPKSDAKKPLSAAYVTEHADDTITVSGYLVQGVWVVGSCHVRG